jgi:hypothetical protein
MHINTTQSIALGMNDALAEVFAFASTGRFCALKHIIPARRNCGRQRPIETSLQWPDQKTCAIEGGTIAELQ